MRRALALLACLMLIPAIPLATNQVQGGKASVGQFKDGSVIRTFAFDAAGSNSSVELELPKDATIVKASVDIDGRPYLQNISLAADTKADFAACNLSNMDINTSEGDMRLIKDNYWSDEFNGGSLDPKWSWYNTPPAYDVGVNRTGCLHVLSPRNVNFAQGADNGILVYQTASGSFHVETAIYSNPQNNYQKSGIMVRQDANNWFMLKYQAQSGQKIQVTTKIGGNANDIFFAYSASPVYLSVERDGNSFSARYCSDGVNWSTVSGGPWTVPLADPVRAGLIVADGTSNTDYSVDFDYFRLERYRSNGSLVSGWTEAPGNVSQARATVSGLLNPQNSSCQLSVRTGPANPWQTLASGVTTQLASPGSNLSYKIEMTSGGLRSPDLGSLKIDFSIPHMPSDISVGLGTQAPFWNLSGELNNTRTIDLRDSLAAFLAAAAGAGNVTIPLKISTSTAGNVILRNLTVEYLIGVPPSAPVLNSPQAGVFLSQSPPILNLSTTDADGDPLLYTVEISDNGFGTFTAYNQTMSGTGWSKGNRSYGSGEHAVLRPTMSFVDGRAYSWRAMAFDGAYWSPYSAVRTFIIDTSPPTGTPRDEGQFTADPANLTATLDFRDNESGVDSYEVWIGTSPGAWDVAANISSSNASIRATGLNLTMGAIYYFTARARNLAGLWSGCFTSDGVMFWPAGVDTEMIRIDQPTPGANLSGVATISGISWLRAGWNINTTVQVRVEDGPWKAATFTGAPPAYARNWTLKWDTTQIPDGNYTVWARIVSGNGSELATDDIPVRVANTVPPTPGEVLEVNFTPAANDTISIPENSSFKFSLKTDARAPSISWAVDGLKRPVEIYPEFTFYAGYNTAGTHAISVTIRWGNLTVQRNWTLEVTDVDQPPVAGILSPLPNSIWRTSEAVTFNGSPSRDPDPEDRLSFSWNLGDGTSYNGTEVVHFYMQPGRYQISLTVSDGRLESRAFLNITVNARPSKVQAAGPQIPVLPLLAIIVAVAAAGAGIFYMRKRKAEREEAERKRVVEEQLAASRPAGAAEKAPAQQPSRTSEISAEEVMRVSEKAAAEAALEARKAPAPKPPAPSYPVRPPGAKGPSIPPPSPPKPGRPTQTQAAEPSLEPLPMDTFDEIPEAETVPATAPAARPVPPPAKPRPPQTAPVLQSQPTFQQRPPASHSTVRPQPHAAARPAAPKAPPSPPASPSGPAKKPESLEDILAALKEK